MKFKKQETTYLIPVEAVQERDTDMLLLEEIKCNKNFTDWLLEKTIGHNHNYKLIGAWHSLTQVSLGESDITFKIRKQRKTILFLIENKVDASFQPEQATRYYKRGEQEKMDGECDEYHTILFAPNQYISKDLGFHFYLGYEELMKWFLLQTNLGDRAKYKAEILKIAIEKLRRGYNPIMNEAATNFKKSYYDFVIEKYPHLNIKKPNERIPKNSGFTRFKPLDLGLQKQDVIIHKKRGVVDLQLAKQTERFDVIIKRYQNTLHEEMDIVLTGKSVSIRIIVPKISMQASFNEQREKVEIILKKIETLYEWGKKIYKRANRPIVLCI